jgi:hypothetical protein
MHKVNSLALLFLVHVSCIFIYISYSLVVEVLL